VDAFFLPFDFFTGRASSSLVSPSSLALVAFPARGAPSSSSSEPSESIGWSTGTASMSPVPGSGSFGRGGGDGEPCPADRVDDSAIVLKV